MSCFPNCVQQKHQTSQQGSKYFDICLCVSYFESYLDNICKTLVPNFCQIINDDQITTCLLKGGLISKDICQFHLPSPHKKIPSANLDQNGSKVKSNLTKCIKNRMSFIKIGLLFYLFFFKMDVFFNPFRSNKILSEERWTSLISTKSLTDTIFVSVLKDWTELKIPFDIQSPLLGWLPLTIPLIHSFKHRRKKTPLVEISQRVKIPYQIALESVAVLRDFFHKHGWD